MKRKITKRFVSIVCLVALSVALMASAYASESTSPSVKEPWYGITAGTDVVVRSDAGTTNGSVFSLGKGVYTQIIGEKFDANGEVWYKILYAFTKDAGYVYGELLDTDNPHNYLTVSANSTGFKTTASATGGNLRTLSKNDALPFYGYTQSTTGERWYSAVCYSYRGYVYGNDVTV